MGSLLATAPICPPVLRSEHKTRGRRGFVGCRSAGKQRDAFLSGAEVAPLPTLSAGMRGEEE